MESAHKIVSGTLLSLSEQQLVDCATSKYNNNGCVGGTIYGSFNYYATYAAMTESAYPYKGV
jgi:cathepsin L